MNVLKSRISFLSKCLMIVVLISSTLACGTQQNVEEEINKIMEEYNTVGLSVAVVKDNEIIYTKAFGLKDIENDVALSSDDIFRIASISKSFTTTSMMQLIEQGKASLDDDVSDLVGFKVRNPAFPNTVITLRMLLSHSSSINDSNGYFTLDVINPAVNEDWAKSYTNVEPGSAYDYCNLCYNMAGAIIERKSDVRFDNYVKENILDPLNLYGGFLADVLDSSKFAQIYNVDVETGEASHSPSAYSINRKRFDNYILGYSAPTLSPTGGMKISVPDLAKYMMMHMNKGTSEGVEIISTQSANAMQSEVIEMYPLSSYGLALRTVEDLIPGETLKGHTGSAYGLYSSMFFHPEKKYGMVVITNGSKNIPTGEYNSLLAPVNNLLYKYFIE